MMADHLLAISGGFLMVVVGCWVWRDSAYVPWLGRILERIASIVIIVGGVSAVINNAARVFGWLP